MRLFITAALFILLIFPSNGQTTKTVTSRVAPPFWWVGMENSTLEILLYQADRNLQDYDVNIHSDGVKLKEVHQVENPHYLFLELEIGANAIAGNFPIFLNKGKSEIIYNFTLKNRKKSNNTNQSLSAKDAIYLVFPDRFSNGDPSNDNIAGMEESVNREDKSGRHGGDIQGIINKLDYIKEMGFTAIWINPLLENDMPEYSYHGYAITDHYNIDPRFGSNEEYLELVKKAQNKGLKIIKDMVYNHSGINHYLFRDLSNTFYNNKGKFKRTSYREPPIMDPHASKSDLKNSVDGWFDPNMPDFNQKNDRVKRYLIQNSLWWIEYSGLDAFRIDTYFYADLAFSAALGKAVAEEYPDFRMFGETWVKSVPMQAYFTQNNGFKNEVNTALSGITDFMLFEAIKTAYKTEMGFTGGVMDVYYVLAQDFLYEDPTQNVVFLDNHDLSRIFVDLGRNPEKFKSVLTFLFTTRGIPCLFYGTEIGMEHPEGDDHGLIRADFSGGWSVDEKDKFTASGRNDTENLIFNLVKTLGEYRLNTPALQTGKLMQFVPENGVYTYFRYDENKTVMVMMNTHNKAVKVDSKRFEERMTGFSTGVNILTNQAIKDISTIHLEPYQTIVLELK